MPPEPAVDAGDRHQEEDDYGGRPDQRAQPAARAERTRGGRCESREPKTPSELIVAYLRGTRAHRQDRRRESRFDRTEEGGRVNGCRRRLCKGQHRYKHKARGEREEEGGDSPGEPGAAVAPTPCQPHGCDRRNHSSRPERDRWVAPPERGERKRQPRRAGEDRGVVRSPAPPAPETIGRHREIGEGHDAHEQISRVEEGHGRRTGDVQKRDSGRLPAAQGHDGSAAEIG